MLRSVLVAGPTGLIGRKALGLLLTDERFGRVIAATRRPLVGASLRLEQWIAADPITALRREHVDAVLCCLGTTMRNVGGDRQAFTHVDKDMVVALAQWAKEVGARSFCVVSSIGADTGSRIFYNRVKGGMEEAVKAMDIPSTHIFRPGVLVGPREEKRTGERVGIALAKLLSPIMVGSMAMYRPMPHDVLAKAIISTATLEKPGVFIHTYRDIVVLARPSTG